MNLSIECPRCRGSQFIQATNPRRDEVVICAGCRIRYHFGELEDLATRAVRKLLAIAFPAMQLD